MRGPALLFCPADRGDRYLKALGAADSVILDLEDAVAPADKPAAREQLIAHAANLDPERVIVRVNPADTDDHALDLEAVAQTPFRTLMLAKAEGAAQLDPLADAGYRVLALCETALGVSRAGEIAAHPAVFALMWGAEDLAASMGGKSSRFDPASASAADAAPATDTATQATGATPSLGAATSSTGDTAATNTTPTTGAYREFARYARSRVLIEAKAAGKQAVDAVYVNIPDLAGLGAEAADASASGFDATACIHPSQAGVIREAYAPTAEEAAWAERVLDEATRQPGVFRFEGKMVDEPVLRQARAMLNRG